MPSPLCLRPLSLCTPTPRQSSALSITSHKRNKSETHKPASTYTWSLKRTRVSGTCPSILEEEKQEPTKQRKIPQRKNVFLSFYILVYKPSIFRKIFLLKKMWKKIAIYIRLLAQGVKFTDFFKLETHTQKKLPQVFLPQHLALVFPLEIL